MEEINKNEFDEDIDVVDIDMDTEAEFDVAQCVNELKNYVTVDDEKTVYKSPVKKHWDSVAFNAIRFNTRVGVMIKIAENTHLMINTYFLCEEAGDPITSNEYISIVKNNIKWFFEYYAQFEDVKNSSTMFYNMAVDSNKRAKANHFTRSALEDSLKFLKHLEKNTK